MKYIIFDFDGTLVDSLDILIKIYNQLAGKYQSNKIEHKDIPYVKGLSIKERCRYLNFKLYKFPLIALDAYKLYRNALKELTMFAGIKELLEKLNEEELGLAVLSTNSDHIIKEFFQHNQINFIKQVVSSNNLYGKEKELKKFLRMHNLKNSEVVYVGDEIRDIIASKRNGIKVIWVSWGYDLWDNVQKEHPDYIANTPEEILDIVHLIRDQR